MDMQMPELDGISATRAIRSLDPPASNTPILAISADSAPERRRIYFEAGIDSFLPKPIVSGQLLDMIGKMRRSNRAPSEASGDQFNRERLNLLVEQAGYEDAAVLMKMLLFDVSDRPQRIAAAARAQVWDVAAAEAEALRTLLDSFGNFSLSRLLAAIARQCARQECQAAVLDELLDQARALGGILQQEFGAVRSPRRSTMSSRQTSRAGREADRAKARPRNPLVAGSDQRDTRSHSAPIAACARR
jgi:hypothetical protein